MTRAAANGRLTRCIAGHLHFEHLDARGRLMSEMSMRLVQAIDLHVALAEAIHDLAEQMSEGRG